MDVLVLRDLENTIRKDIPSFKVGFKDESTLLKVLGFLSYPFNPNFMTSFTTTLGTTVYFPTRSFYEGKVSNSFNILTHEYVHLWDKKQNKLFELTYALPQLLALVGFVVFGVLAWPHSWLLALPFLGYVLAALVGRTSLFAFGAVLGAFMLTTWGLSIWLTQWDTIALVAACLCLGPWPSPARTNAEMRAYTMSIAVNIWLGGSYTSTLKEGLVEEFTGPSYYFMSWSRSSIEASLDEAAALTTSGGLQGRSPPYATIYEFLYQHGLIAPPRHG